VRLKGRLEVAHLIESVLFRDIFLEFLPWFSSNCLPYLAVVGVPGVTDMGCVYGNPGSGVRVSRYLELR